MARQAHNQYGAGPDGQILGRESLFAGQPNEKKYAIADALDSLPNERYRCLLVGLYPEHFSMQFMAEEMEVSLPTLYNLHRRALASLKAHIAKQNNRPPTPLSATWSELMG